VGMSELHADIDAREFCTIDEMKGRCGGHQNFDACIRGGVRGSCSKEGGPAF
jgi:hypothetical protein